MAQDSGGYVFNQDGAKRIVKAVRAVEGSDLSNGRTGGGTPGMQCITARLIAQDSDKYSWEQVRRLTTGWETIAEGLTGTLTERQAWQLDESDTSDLTNKIVTLVRVAGKDGDGKANQTWVIVGTASLPTGEFMGMVYGMVTNNQSGWDFPRLYPPLS